MTTISLHDLCIAYKVLRNFEASKYIGDKIVAINKFFFDNKLDAAVIGISGGVDSAVALALLVEASKQSGSPIKKILPLSMPIDYEGMSGQKVGSQRAKEVFGTFGFEWDEIPLTEVYRQIIDMCDRPVDRREWAYGQMGSILRTPILYYHAAMLQTQGYRSIVVGTTNRDEGSYIGFFGKASDAMVDLQPIADIHKGEVWEVAKMLKVPESVINAVPEGGVWDGRDDEDMIGAPYWFLEMVLLAKEYGKADDLMEKLDPYAQKWLANIERLHEMNKHKYEVGNPAHFIDVMNRKIPGGWQ